MKSHYYINLAEGGRTIQGDYYVIEESALKEVVGYFGFKLLTRYLAAPLKVCKQERILFDKNSSSSETIFV